MDLHDRINKVINTEAFEKSLEGNDSDLIDFQTSWSKYKTFDSLPEVFKEAILAGESELNSSGSLCLT